MKRYDFPKKTVLVSGHRGESCFGLENTMFSFKRALSLGVDMIETDVHMTRDGHLVLMHDDSVERTTNGNGKIRDLTLGEIKWLDATVNAKIHVESEAPPTLSELLDLLEKYPNVLLNIELKEYPLYDKAFSYGSRIVNSDEPEKMLAHLKEKGMHR